MGDAGAGTDGSCFATEVVVDGHQAVWLFTEFETAETLDHLRDWLKPDNWPSWGGAMFEEMRPVGPVTEVPTPAAETQTSANYLEVVRLAGQTLHTVLACEFKSTPTWAGMSYDLDHSVGDVLTVDRGYLVAIDTGGTRLVKALKVVGFTDTRLNSFATAVCPEWGIWVRRATAVAAAEASRGYVDPTPGSVGDGDPRVADPGGDANAFTGGYAEELAETISEQAKFYGEYAADVSGRMWSGKYGREDAVTDSSRLFMRLARDWSRAWKAGVEMADSWADADVEPTAGPGGAGAPGRSIEHTALLVPPQRLATALTITDLARVGRDSAVLAASTVSLMPPTVGPSDDDEYVTLQADTTNLVPGLYEGKLLLGGTDCATVPAIFYAGRARPLQ